MEEQKDYSYGVIPVLKRQNGFLFLIIQNADTKSGNWGFPKGHAEGNEDPTTAAKRELAEETGIKEVELMEAFKYVSSYVVDRDGKFLDKTVVFFLGFVGDENVVIQEKEVKAFKWATYEEAMNMFVYDDPKRILDQVVKDLTAL